MRPLLLSALGLVLATGCSGSSPEAAPDPKPAYVEAATEVCSSADEDFAALTPPTAPAQFGPYVEQTVEIAQRAQDELSALPAPPDDRAELESKVLDPFSQLVTDGRAFADRVAAAGTDDAALLSLLQERPTATDIDAEFLREYGLGACADALGKVG